MLRLIVSVGTALLAIGCASDLLVFDAAKAPVPGIPVGTPVLVKMTTTTSYVVAPGKAHVPFASFCIDDATDSYEILPLGALHYISFAPAKLGKSEFSLEFGDSGLLKSVKLNSDPRTPENIEAASKLLDSIGEVAGPAFGISGGPPVGAQSVRDAHCLKKKVERTITRATLP